MENLNIPNHIAIILDGNGRWAKMKGKPRTYGHKVGFDLIEPISIYAKSLGVKALSLYCFSTENWNRPEGEVNYLMSVPSKFENKISKYKENNIKVIVSGRKTKVPEATLKSLNKLEEETKDSTGLILNICFDYGALYDIKCAINDIINSGIKEVNDNTIYDYLSTKDLPKVDLMIRTGGELRLSNFLLLECAYAEFYFTNKYWPEFKESDLLEAIKDYSSRNRRFGGIKNE